MTPFPPLPLRLLPLVIAVVAMACGGEAGRAAGAETPAAPTAPQPARLAAPPQTRALPAVDAPIAVRPRELAAVYARRSRELRAAIDRWRAEGDPRRDAEPPRDVARLALFQQRVVRVLARRPARWRGVLRALPPPARAELRDLVAARRALLSIRSVVVQRPRIRVGPAEPVDRLRAHYSRAFRRFGVGPPLLAAVNFVESSFGRLRNESTAGARGPMQFMPATWREYGLGGDVHDPRDAILGAANLLRANGAPGDEARALYRYNPSDAYVESVRRYARRIRADERALYAFYAWQVYVRRDGRVRRLTDHGLG